MFGKTLSTVLFLPILIAGMPALLAQGVGAHRIHFEVSIAEREQVSDVTVTYSGSPGLPQLTLAYDARLRAYAGDLNLPQGYRQKIEPLIVVRTQPPGGGNARQVMWKLGLGQIDTSNPGGGPLEVRGSLRLVVLAITAARSQGAGEVPTRCQAMISTGETSGLVMEANFPNDGTLLVSVPMSTNGGSAGGTVTVTGTASAAGATQMPEVANGTVTVSGAAPRGGYRVKLLFDDWLAGVRIWIEDELEKAGVPAAQAREIGLVDIERNAQCGEKPRWEEPLAGRERLFWFAAPDKCRRGGVPWIALPLDATPSNPDFGDTLGHEWVHEVGYVLGTAAAGGGGHEPFVCGGYDETPNNQTLPWDEATSDFLGSFVLTRALNQAPMMKGMLNYSREGNWADDAKDSMRQHATNCLAPTRPNPGAYVEYVLSWALHDLYEIQGLDADKDADKVLKAFMADWRAYAASTPMARRAGPGFFENVRGRLDRNHQKALDQLALWYRIWDRREAEEVDQIANLVPVKLEAEGGLQVQSGQKVSLKSRAWIFPRLVGVYRGDAPPRLRVRLIESDGRQIGNGEMFKDDSHEAGYNFAAEFSTSWSNTSSQAERHTVHAEVMSDFIDGTTERVGLSNSLEITVAGTQRQQTQRPSNTSTVPAGPTAQGGHWERGKALIEWTYRPPTDDKTGRKLGASPSAGDTWVEGGDWAHQISYTLASIGENQYTTRYVFIADPKQVNYEMSGAWTLPPTTLTPGQKFIMQVASGNATPLGAGGASCYAWQGEETNNEHLINTDGPNQTLTAQPFTIPKGSPNAQFGFFCGGSVKWVYTYHWVGGGN
jgi:hypothetical protein